MKAKRVLKSIGKWFLFLLGGIIGLVLILVLIIRINSTGREEPFKDENGKIIPNSIAVIEDKVINGAPQRLTIRGKDVNNPVLLKVHGGPGYPHIPPMYRILGIDLEDLFVVCYWDQRGSGPAYTPDIPDSTLTLPQIVYDGLEVAAYLKSKFNKEKIYIEGASWGTTVAAFMVQKKPEIFHAYIGIGQMANQPLSEQMSYDFAMNEARKNNDTLSINQLLEIGRPPYPDKTNVEMAEACDIERLVVDKYVPVKVNLNDFETTKKILLYNGWTFKEKMGPFFNPDYIGPGYKILWPTCFNINLMRDIPVWEIPVYIIQGDTDYYTDTSLAIAYYDSIQAPSKKLYLFENASHPANWEQPEKFREIIINDVLRQ
jgi:pimeloyl-ACP methyl ester carboxylesterase